MAITEAKKQSDLEKRLKLLRQQVYGKSAEKLTYRHTDNPIASDSLKSTDITYLHQDLFKILTLSSLAIGVQLILFILMKNHVLNLNFF